MGDLDKYKTIYEYDIVSAAAAAKPKNCSVGFHSSHCNSNIK